MKFNEILKEEFGGSLQFSIDLVLEMAIDKTNKKVSANCRWANASYKDPEDVNFKRLKRLTSFEEENNVDVKNLRDKIVRDFSKIGMDQYLAKSSDPSWSEMYTSLAQIVKLYPAKMRAIQTQAGEDAVVHIRYDMSSDGKKRFLPRGDHMKSGATVINPKEQEQFQSKAVTM